jgi:hypothetical protein
VKNSVEQVASVMPQLDILTDSPSAKHLEPLIVGLKLFIGEKMKVAVEIREVANDVVKRIEELRAKRVPS